MHRLILALLLILLSARCAHTTDPKAVECRQRVDRCMSRCEPRPRPAEPAQTSQHSCDHGPKDECAERCYEDCEWAADGVTSSTTAARARSSRL